MRLTVRRRHCRCASSGPLKANHVETIWTRSAFTKPICPALLLLLYRANKRTCPEWKRTHTMHKQPCGSSSLQELWLIICTQRPWTRRAAPLARLIAAKWTGIYRPSRSPVRRKRRDVSFSPAHCSVHSERAPVLPSWAWPRQTGQTGWGDGVGELFFYRGSPTAPLRLHHPHISSSHGGPARHCGQALCVFWNPGLRVCVCVLCVCCAGGYHFNAYPVSCIIRAQLTALCRVCRLEAREMLLAVIPHGRTRPKGTGRVG